MLPKKKKKTEMTLRNGRLQEATFMLEAGREERC
jgi:hypothetical protein